MTAPAFRPSVATTLTPRAQRLVDAYEATYGSSGPGCCPQALAAVLDYLVSTRLFKPAPTDYLKALAAEVRGGEPHHHPLPLPADPLA